MDFFMGGGGCVRSILKDFILPFVLIKKTWGLYKGSNKSKYDDVFISLSSFNNKVVLKFYFELVGLWYGLIIVNL